MAGSVPGADQDRHVSVMGMDDSAKVCRYDPVFSANGGAFAINLPRHAAHDLPALACRAGSAQARPWTCRFWETPAAIALAGGERSFGECFGGEEEMAGGELLDTWSDVVSDDRTEGIRAGFRLAARRLVASLGAIALIGLTACAAGQKAPPGGDYRKVSELVRFPDFFPGLGTLYVQPETLPHGPFRAYDRDGDLVSTIYMVPMRSLNAHERLAELQGAPLPVSHVNMHYTSGHPGVDEPHYHVILWHVSPEEAARRVGGPAEDFLPR
jgi:hypothetical protein